MKVQIRNPTTKMNQTQNFGRTFFILHRLACLAAEKTFNHLTKLEGKSIPLMDERSYVYGFQMAMTPILTPEFRILLKLHYTYELQELLFQNRKLTDLDGFVHEMCNQIAGEIRKILERNGYASGAGIPVVTKAFDELVYKVFRKPDQDFFYWQMFDETKGLVFSTTIDIMDQQQSTEKIERLNQYLSLQLTEDGHDEIELF